VTPPLDKLAQLGNFDIEQKKKWSKKARAKVLTNAITRKLLDANTESDPSRQKMGYTSPNTKAYFRTFACNQYLFQDGYKVTSHYCKNRWCIVCNRIRAANLINGYLPSLGELQDKQFVTLTIPNCKGRELPEKIHEMYQAFVKVKGQLKKAYQKGTLPQFNGLRKIECTYNPKSRTFHPHYHLIVEGREMAQELVKRWLKQFPEASIKAQDIREATEGSELEMFKYFTKLFNEGEIDGKALDTIFVAIKGRRIFQNYGKVKKVSEDIPELQSEDTRHKGYRTEVWKWIDEAFDWLSPEGEVFAEYEPSHRIRELAKQTSKADTNEQFKQSYNYREGDYLREEGEEAQTIESDQRPCASEKELYNEGENDGEGMGCHQRYCQFRGNSS